MQLPHLPPQLRDRVVDRFGPQLEAGLAPARRLGTLARHVGTRARTVPARNGRGTVPGMLSVIVPVYNVEQYIEECLLSLRFQLLHNVEIVVVDDGTPDDSISIVRRHQRRDPRIRVVRRPNGGLSAARNTGVAAARGEFIAFADSDDTVPPHGYLAAVESLLESGSDFAVLPYQRLKGGLVTPGAPWIREAHAEERIGVTVEEFPGIQVNAIMCSKVFRRDFWTGIGLTFVEGIIYEDQQVSAEAYTRARAFDVLTTPVYNWRARADQTSISQNKKETANLHAQFAAARESIDVLRTNGSQRVVRERIVQLLSNDMAPFTYRVVGARDDFWQLLADDLPPLIDLLDPEDYVAAIPAHQKVLNHLIATGQREAVIRFIEAGGTAIRAMHVGEEAVGRVAYLPLWQDPSAEIPPEMFVLSDGQTRARCTLRAVTPTGPSTVSLEVWACIQNVDLAVHAQTVRAFAQSRGQDDVPLGVEQFTDDAIDEFTAVGGSGFCDYRPGGVRVHVDLATLPAGTWTIRLEIEAGSLHRTVALGRPWSGGTAGLRHAMSAGGDRAVVLSTRDRRLQLRVFEGDVVVDDVRVHEGHLHLSGRGRVPGALRAVRRTGARVAARVEPAADGRWTAEADLSRGGWEPGPPGTPTQWRFEAFEGQPRPGRELPVRFAPADPMNPRGGLRWRALVERNDELVLRRWRAGAQVVDAQIDDDGARLTLETFGLDLDDYELLFESRPHTSTAVVERDGDRLVCRLPFREERWGRPDQVLVSAPYTLALAHNGTGQTVSPRVAHALVEQLPQERLLPYLRCRLQLRSVDQGAMSVVVAPPLLPDERGFRNQLLMEERANAGSGSDRSVFFRTLYGEAANDNALAIHHELRRRNSDLTLYWSVRDRSVPLPEGAVGLIEDSREWHERLGDAGYVVVNVHQPMWYRKPEKQVMVETFHGYPYKGMGLTWWDRSGLTAGRISAFLERSGAWDYLVSPASYATPHLLESFFTPESAADVEVLEVGYPRNDILLSPEGEVVRKRVRDALGIEDGQRAVLYAPTFRDYLSNDGMTAQSGDFFDPQAAADALGPGYVVLQRGHAFNARANEARVRGTGVIDVTYYPDIAELCLASDAAILDYSSLRFDYALMRKPMVFLVPDKEEYHALRPAIMDYDPTAPGPHVDTTEQAVTALRDLDAVRRKHGDDVERFIATYMELEDGHAAARVVDAVFNEPRAGGPGEEQ